MASAPRPVSNQFDYVPVRELPGFAPDPADCPARPLGLHRVASSRVVVVRAGGRAVLCRTDTGDFPEREIRDVVHGRGQLYLDVSGKPAVDDFGADVRQVVVSDACRRCPDLPSCAACYDPAPRSFFHEDEAEVAAWLSSRAGRVLDVGMGWVPYLDALREGIAAGRVEYHGLDPEPPVLEAARGSGLPLHLHEGTIESFDPARGPFDAVVALRSLNHFQDVGRALDVVAACLRPGGEAFLVESLPLPLVRSRRHAKDCHDRGAGGWQHVRNADSSDVLGLLPGRPFRVLRHRPVGRDTCDQWIVVLQRA